jgi:hypothetical protein
MAKSSFPLALKSAEINPLGLTPVAMSARPKETAIVGLVIWKKSTFEVGDPVVATLMEAVPKLATSDAGIAAVNRFALLKAVVRGLPFHSTAEHKGTNPVPLTVSDGNDAPPGTELSGANGWLISGTGAAVTVNVSAGVPRRLKFPSESWTCTVKG